MKFPLRVKKAIKQSLCLLVCGQIQSGNPSPPSLPCLHVGLFLFLFFVPHHLPEINPSSPYWGDCTGVFFCGGSSGSREPKKVWHKARIYKPPWEFQPVTVCIAPCKALLKPLCLMTFRLDVIYVTSCHVVNWIQSCHEHCYRVTETIKHSGRL